MEEEVFAAKRRALQVADDELKWKKTRSTLELLKKNARRRRGSHFSRPTCRRR